MFCSSLLLKEGQSTKDSDILIRAYIEEESVNIQEEEIPSVILEEGNENELEGESSFVKSPSAESSSTNLFKPSTSQFITFPTISLPTHEGALDEDIISFINQIPGYGTYSFVCFRL